VGAGGRTVHADVKEINDVMAFLGKKFNLKPHLVGDATGEEVELSAPGDIGVVCRHLLLLVADRVRLAEVHLGRDNRVYVLDTARLFPPQPPTKCA